MKSSTMKALGIVATIIGIGANLLSDFVGDKKMEVEIKEMVLKAIAEKDNKKG